MKKAFQVIILFGLISLFGDLIYEGARSVNGPYLKTLGAGAAAIGLFAGLGEFLGYAVRLISGYLSDRTRSYWFFIFLGYALLISVPLLSISGTWEAALFLIVIERVGKGLRGPARDTVVSMASSRVGTGVGFGITEVLDQIGAITGPLLFMGLFFFAGTGPEEKASVYQKGYGLFWVPFIILLTCLCIAYLRVPRPDHLESRSKDDERPGQFSKLFWIYTAFTFVATFGFVNFILLGYHFKTEHIFSDPFIPFIYAVAMAVDAVAAIVIGKIYDVLKKKSARKMGGLAALAVIPVLSIAIALCAFSHMRSLAISGMVLWGVVMGAHETVMRSAVADLTPLARRGSGYGIFNACYGLALFIGSAVMGLLYGFSLPILIIAVICIECAAIIIFMAMRKEAIRAGIAA